MRTGLQGTRICTSTLSIEIVSLAHTRYGGSMYDPRTSYETPSQSPKHHAYGVVASPCLCLVTTATQDRSRIYIHSRYIRIRVLKLLATSQLQERHSL